MSIQARLSAHGSQAVSAPLPLFVVTSADPDPGNSDVQKKRHHPLRTTRLDELERMIREAGPFSHGNSALSEEYERRKKYSEQGRPFFEATLKELVNARRLLIIDLECTCDPDPAYRGEVIEIGAVLVDVPEMALIEQLQLFTKPTSTEVNAFCTQITGIASETVHDAPSFRGRMRELGDFVSEHGIDTWASYGKYDKNQFMRQCEREDVVNPLGKLNHINLKSVVGSHFGYGKISPGLNAALQLTQIERHGKAHCGLDDAKSAAGVLGWLLKARGLIESAELRLPSPGGRRQKL